MHGAHRAVCSTERKTAVEFFIFLFSVVTADSIVSLIQMKASINFSFINF